MTPPGAGRHFHYGRWVNIDGFWAWAPGPAVRRPVYSPALVAFMIRDHDVSLRLSVGLPGLWWVALSWGEPVYPWWGRHEHRGHPRWAGWGGPRIVIDSGPARYRNAALPRALLTVAPDKFGREPFRATFETRFNHTHFTTVRGDLPIKPSRHNLIGGAAKGFNRREISSPARWFPPACRARNACPGRKSHPRYPTPAARPCPSLAW